MSASQLARRCTAITFICLLLASCAHQPATSNPGLALQQHTEALAGSVFSPAHGSQPQRIGVGSLVPVHSLRQQGNGRDRLMVQQIQEGLISAATQRGANIVEFRTSTQLRLEDEQELMLSRQIEDLSVRQRLDYFLTGTYSEVSGGLLVNVRLINVRTNSVERAATHFFPWVATQGDGELSEMRHGQLYRHSTQANSPQQGQGQARGHFSRHRQP